MSFEQLLVAYRNRRAEAARIAAAEHDRSRRDLFRQAVSGHREFVNDELEIVSDMLYELELSPAAVEPLLNEVAELRIRFAKLDEARAEYADACRWSHPDLHRIGAGVTDCVTAYERLVKLATQYPVIIEHPGPWPEVPAPSDAPVAVG